MSVATPDYSPDPNPHVVGFRRGQVSAITCWTDGNSMSGLPFSIANVTGYSAIEREMWHVPLVHWWGDVNFKTSEWSKHLLAGSLDLTVLIVCGETSFDEIQPRNGLSFSPCSSTI